MIAIREHFGLVRQVRTTRIDQVDAWQFVLCCHFLSPQMLFDCDWIISAAFHRWIVRHNHAQRTGNLTNSSDHSACWQRLPWVQVFPSELQPSKSKNSRLEMVAPKTWPSSKKAVPLSRILLTRSRTRSFLRLRCLSIALGPPPVDIWSQRIR